MEWNTRQSKNTTRRLSSTLEGKWETLFFKKLIIFFYCPDYSLGVDAQSEREDEWVDELIIRLSGGSLRNLKDVLNPGVTTVFF